MSTSASDEISRLGRLEGQVLGIAESVPHMQEELERLRARTSELTRGLSSEREGRVNLSGFPELRGTVGRLQAEMSNLQARVDISPTLSRANESSRQHSVELPQAVPNMDFVICSRACTCDRSSGKSGRA
ncbi:unnamed protein product [Ascophyllum nodosum]